MNSKYRWFRRYFSITALAVIVFMLFVLFFNDNSVMKKIEYSHQIEELKAEIKENEDTLLYYQDLNDRLYTDRETMEKIVREQYHMQRPSEDVYVFD